MFNYIAHSMLTCYSNEMFIIIKNNYINVKSIIKLSVFKKQNLLLIIRLNFKY